MPNIIVLYISIIIVYCIIVYCIYIVFIVYYCILYFYYYCLLYYSIIILSSIYEDKIPHFIHLSMDTFTTSIFWLLWIILLWTWVYKYLLETLLSILLGVYIFRSGIAGSYDTSIFTFLRNHCTVCIAAASFYIPTNSVRGFQFLHILANHLLFPAIIILQEPKITLTRGHFCYGMVFCMCVVGGILI